MTNIAAVARTLEHTCGSKANKVPTTMAPNLLLKVVNSFGVNMGNLALGLRNRMVEPNKKKRVLHWQTRSVEKVPIAPPAGLNY
jgi:hypothetical protein